jgi:ribosomal protein L37AE/L43A
MSVDRQNGVLWFECDDCGETLDTGEWNFMQAVEVMRNEGWWAIGPTYDGDEWTHQCSDCKPQRERRGWG